MKCKWTVRKIYQWLDGELKNARKVAFESHLTGCVTCSKEIELARTFCKSLRAANTHIEPSPGFEATFWKKIYAREHESWLSKLLKDIESLVPVPTFSQAFAIFLIALLVGGTGGVVSAMNIITPARLEGEVTSVKYLSGFHEFQGLPSSSVAATYLKVVRERNRT